MSNKVLKSTLIIMVVSILSRGIGFIRDLLIAGNFGTGVYTDAYNIAVTIPETLFMVIGLAISTSFLPILSEQLIKNGRKEMYEFANKFITLLSFISVAVFVFAFIFAEDIVPFFAKGFDSERLTLTITLTRITILNLLFLAVNACFTAILQVNEDFVVPSVLGLFFNAPMIIYLLFFHSYSIVGLTIANVIGNAARVLVQVPSLKAHGYKLKFNMDYKDERIRRVLVLIAPVIIGAGANSLNLAVDKTVASSLETGSVSALDFAQKLIVFLNTIITTSVLTVAYPLMANKRNSGDDEGFTEYIKKTLIYCVLLLVPITCGAIIYNKEIIEIVYMRGQFAKDSVNLTKTAFLGYLIGLAFYGVRDILNSILFSMGKTRDTTINGIIGVAVNILLILILAKPLGILGIAVSTSSSLIVTSMMLLLNVNRILPNFKLGDLLFKMLKVLLASAIMGAVLILINNILKIDINIITIIPAAFLGAIVFYLLCIILKVKEINEISKLFLSKFRRK